MDEKRKNGSITVEAACISPLLLLVFVLSIRGTFYYHDKNLILSTAYETAVVCATLSREEGGLDITRAEALFRERIRGKLILFGSTEVSVSEEAEELTVSVNAAANKMEISARARAKLTEPEEKIRRKNILKKAVGAGKRK